jgi:hypothetical protein
LTAAFPGSHSNCSATVHYTAQKPLGAGAAPRGARTYFVLFISVPHSWRAHSCELRRRSCRRSRTRGDRPPDESRGGGLRVLAIRPAHRFPVNIGYPLASPRPCFWLFAPGFHISPGYQARSPWLVKFRVSATYFPDMSRRPSNGTR